MWFELVSVALGSGFVTSVSTYLLSRGDRASERRADRSQTHRDELRLAYADYVGAYSNFLNLGDLTMTMELANQAIRKETYDSWLSETQNPDIADRKAGPGSMDLIAKIKARFDEWIEAGMVADTKEAAVLMLEDEPGFVALIKQLGDAPIRHANSIEDVLLVTKDLAKKREHLQALLARVAGRFVPEKWDPQARDAAVQAALHAGAKARELPGSAPAALPSKTEET